MIDGKYSIVMQTPMGPVNGTLLLKTEGETLSGVLGRWEGGIRFLAGPYRARIVHFQCFSNAAGQVAAFRQRGVHGMCSAPPPGHRWE